MAKKRIGILTGGGDVPGLNSVIKSVVYRSTEHADFEVIGIRRGWEGLTHVNLDVGSDSDYLNPLDRQVTRSIDRTGGTFLHTSRTNPSRMQLEKLPGHLRQRAGELKEVSPGVVDATPIVLENLERLKIDCLIAIGGDDTLSYAAVLHGKGFPIVGVPKTMDNDVRHTEYCVGFSTAMTRAVEFIGRLRTTVGSHERIGVLRIFGRDAGFTALYAAFVTSIRCCIPEAPFDLERLIEQLIEDKWSNPSRYSMVLLSEGASWVGHELEGYGEVDPYGHQKKRNIAEALSEQIKQGSGEETLVADLAYELRSGEPDFLDRMVATSFAAMAFESAVSGGGGRMTAVCKGCFDVVDIPDPSLGARRVDVKTMYNVDRFRPDYSTKKGFPIFLLSA